jgi:hypothetical protein
MLTLSTASGSGMDWRCAARCCLQSAQFRFAPHDNCPCPQRSHSFPSDKRQGKHQTRRGSLRGSRPCSKWQEAVIRKDDIEYVVSRMDAAIVRGVESQWSVRGRWPWGTMSGLIRIRGCRGEGVVPHISYLQWIRTSYHAMRMYGDLSPFGASCKEKRSTADWYPVESALLGVSEAVRCSRKVGFFRL